MKSLGIGLALEINYWLDRGGHDTPRSSPVDTCRWRGNSPVTIALLRESYMGVNLL